MVVRGHTLLGERLGPLKSALLIWRALGRFGWCGAGRPRDSVRLRTGKMGSVIGPIPRPGPIFFLVRPRGFSRPVLIVAITNDLLDTIVAKRPLWRHAVIAPSASLVPTAGAAGLSCSKGVPRHWTASWIASRQPFSAHFVDIQVGGPIATWGVTGLGVVVHSWGWAVALSTRGHQRRGRRAGGRKMFFPRRIERFFFAAGFCFSAHQIIGGP